MTCAEYRPHRIAAMLVVSTAGMIRALVLILLAALAPAPAWAQSPDGDTVMFSNDDPEMNAAIRRARASLPRFWQEWRDPRPGDSDFMLKIAVPHPQGVEHLWCGAIEGDEERASCAVANEPEFATDIALGQRINIGRELISDWMYLTDGLITGAETLRVIITRVPEDEAAYYRSMLADP